MTSDAALCAHPTPETIVRLPLDAEISEALAHADESSRTVRWVALPLSIEWANEYSDETAPSDARTLLQGSLAKIAT